MKIRRVDLDTYLATLRGSDLPAGPFSCAGAVESWWKHHGAGGHFVGLLGEDRGRLVAALPLQEAFLGRVLRPCGHGLSCELEIAAERGWAAPFLGHAIRHCAQETGALALDLIDVRAGGDAWTAAQDLPHLGVFSYSCPYVRIDGDWQKRVKRKRRHEIRRTLRRLAEHGEVRHQVIDQHDHVDLERRLDQCIALHASRNEGTWNTSGFSQSPREAWYRDLLGRHVPEGRALLSCLLLDDEVVSFFMGVVRDRSFIAMVTAFDERHAAVAPGHLNIFHAMGDLNERGYHVLDFSKGWYTYKKRWTKDAYDLHHLIFPLRLGEMTLRTVGRLLTVKDRGRELGVNERARELLGRLRVSG